MALMALMGLMALMAFFGIPCRVVAARPLTRATRYAIAQTLWVGIPHPKLNAGGGR